MNILCRNNYTQHFQMSYNVLFVALEILSTKMSTFSWPSATTEWNIFSSPVEEMVP